MPTHVNRLLEQAQGLMNEAARLKPGRDRDGSDIWAHPQTSHARERASARLAARRGRSCQPGVARRSGSGGLRIRRLPGTRVSDIGGCHSGLRRERPGDASGCRAGPEVGAAGRAQRPGPELLRAHDGSSGGAAQNWKSGFNVDERARWLADGTNSRRCLTASSRAAPIRAAGPDALRFPPWVTDDKRLHRPRTPVPAA